MTLDYYRIFYYVAKYKSMTKAATFLKNDQSNISRYISYLESELGCQLFLRSRRGVTLTEEGEALYEHVSIAMKQLIAGEEEVQSHGKLDGGSIAIGVSELALSLFLLEKLKLFKRDYPSVKLKLINSATPDAIKSLERGLVDFAVVTTPLKVGGDFVVTEISSFQEILLGGKEYKELATKKYSLKELEGYPFVSLAPGTGTNNLYSNFFMENNVDFDPDMTVATTDQILPVISSELALGFYPEKLSLEAIKKKTVYQIPIKEKIPSRKVCLVRDRSNSDSPAVKCLIEQYL